MSAVQEKYRCERPIQHRSLSSKQLWCSVPEGKEFASCQKCIRSKLRKPKKASSIFFLLLFDHLAQQISENAPPRMVNLPASVLFPYTMMCVSTYIRKKGKDKKSKDVRLHLNFHEINVQIRLLFVGILEHSLMFGMLFFVAQWILRINIRGVRLDGEKNGPSVLSEDTVSKETFTGRIEFFASKYRGEVTLHLLIGRIYIHMPLRT